MSHQAVSRLCCLSLLLSLSTTACKTAPQKPDFAPNYASVQLDPVEAELADLQAQKAEALAERDRLNLLYQKGASADVKSFDYKSYASDVSSSVKDQDDELKTYGGEPQNQNWNNNNHGQCQDWLRKIMEHIKGKCGCIEKKIEEIEQKIEACKAKRCQNGCNKGWEPGKGGENQNGGGPIITKGGDVITKGGDVITKGGDVVVTKGGNVVVTKGGDIPSQNNPGQNGK